MNLRKTPASSMQKTYDECYLTCSTAIYFEEKNNEAEALRAWRNALDQIYYHNAYKIPSSYTPKTETEKALRDSLRSMELQCKERVELLEALRKSREEAQEDGKPPATTNGSSSRGRDSLPARLKSPAEDKRTWLGNDTIPQASYKDLPVPARPSIGKRITQDTRPANVRRISEQEGVRTRSLPHVTSAAAFTPPALAPPTQEKVRQSRTPSPEKKGGMLRTLRKDSGKDKEKKMPASMRSKPIPAAAKAATQVWSGPRQSVGSAEQVQPTPLPMAAPAPQAWDPFTRSLVNTAPAPAPERRVSAQSIVRQPSPTDFLRPRRDEISRPSSQLSNTNPTARPEQSYLNAYRPNLATSSSTSAAAAAPPPVPPHGLPSRVTPSEYTAPSPVSLSEDKRLPLPPSLSKVGQAQALPYMREYPNHPPAKPRKPPEIAMKKAASLAVGSSSRTVQSNSVPIARKAIGTSRAAGLVNAIAQRRELDEEQNRAQSAGLKKTIAAQSSPADLSPKPVILDEVPVLNGDDSGPDEIDVKAWDAKVKHLLDNLPKGVDETAAKQILNEIVIQGDEVHWADVAGLEIAKSALKETVVYPFLRPDLFMGLREPARGMLLFGPPGTGKTMLARAVATESRSVFFAISASSLTSKFLGESEKLVRALFAMAKVMAPSIIFVDEIDSLLGARGGSSEHEATRRIKTEFLIQWSDLQKAAAGRVDDKKDPGDATRVLVLAATNLPWAIDEAARRRFVRRQYIPLPEGWVRQEQLQTLLAAQKHSLSERELVELVALTDGFSGSDVTALAKDAAMGPLRSLGEKLLHMSPDDIRPIGMQDFRASLKNIRPSVSKQGLKEFEDWATEFGERGG